jgi:hypothetical protein
MNERDARQLVESFATTADEVLTACGEVLPVMFFNGKSGMTTLDLRDMFTGPREQKHKRKNAGTSAIRHILKQEDADWCLLIVEAWSVEIKPPKGADLDATRDKIPADLEDYQGRVEVVWFQFEDQELGQILAKRPIVREGDKPRLGPIEWAGKMKSSEGRMVGLLPQRGRPQ